MGAGRLDDTYRGVAGRFAVNDAVSVDADGRLHVERIKAIPEPGSLIDLRKRVGAMLPRVDLPEVLREHDTEIDIREFTRLGLLAVPAALVLAALALWASLTAIGG